MPRRPMRPMRPQRPPPVLSGGRSVHVSRNAGLGGMTLRRGDDILGHIGRVGDDTAEWLAGTFTHTPAFSEQAELFQKLEAARDAGDADAAKALADQLEKLDIHVHHGGHDMRIDDPGTLTVTKGQVRFRASPAFIILRNGGL